MAKRENRFARTPGAGADPVPDEALVRRLLDADVEAFERLYERHAPRVFALCLRILRSREVAQEVLQDAFWQLWERPGQFDPDRGRLPTFLFQIARSRSLDRLRRERLRTPSHPELATSLEIADLATSVPTPLQSASITETRTRVLEALDGVPPECREVLVLAYFEGLTRTEIAEHLGIPVGTVKTRVRRGLKILRTQVEPGDEP